jgi:ABC-type antimicrobial peptide transport system permease subunit
MDSDSRHPVRLCRLRRVCIHTCASVLFYGVTQLNVVSFAVAIALVVGICATPIPALNAAQVEPSQVLREE